MSVFFTTENRKLKTVFNMRLAIISDIHSNLEALEAVIEQIRREKVDAVLNLGDLIGYNASPNECLELVIGEKWFNLAGNHDLALLEPERAEGFNLIAHQALMWSREQILPAWMPFLEALPLTQELGGRLLACHGTPTSADTYISYHFQGKRVFAQMRQNDQLKVCFFGHTHRRALWCRDIRGTVSSLEVTRPKVTLDRKGHYLINPGSVGQPRDGSPEAAYAIFDLEEFAIHFKSVPYDIAGAQRRILNAGLSPFLAERLAQGR